MFYHYCRSKQSVDQKHSYSLPSVSKLEAHWTVTPWKGKMYLLSRNTGTAWGASLSSTVYSNRNVVPFHLFFLPLYSIEKLPHYRFFFFFSLSRHLYCLKGKAQCVSNDVKLWQNKSGDERACPADAEKAGMKCLARKQMWRTSRAAANASRKGRGDSQQHWS